jgi:hypothetical protein
VQPCPSLLLCHFALHMREDESIESSGHSPRHFPFLPAAAREVRLTVSALAERTSNSNNNRSGVEWNGMEWGGEGGGRDSDTSVAFTHITATAFLLADTPIPHSRLTVVCQMRSPMSSPCKRLHRCHSLAREKRTIQLVASDSLLTFAVSARAPPPPRHSTACDACGGDEV